MKSEDYSIFSVKQDETGAVAVRSFHPHDSDRAWQVFMLGGRTHPVAYADVEHWPDLAKKETDDGSVS